MLKEILGENGFCKTLAPKIFMTDDGRAEKNALKSVWPDSVQLLCIFHVLQVCFIPEIVFVHLIKDFRLVINHRKY